MRKFAIFLTATLASSVACFSAQAKELNYESPAVKAGIQKITGDIKSGVLVEVSASKLARDYQSNEVTADGRYKGKTLFIQGTVDNVSKDVFGKIVVGLRTDNQFLTATAHFAPEVGVISGLEGGGEKVVTHKRMPVVEAVSLIRKGSKIHLICVGDGFTVGMPQLEQCNVLSR